MSDAGQAFEALKFSLIEETLGVLFSKVAANKVASTVTVTHGKPFKEGVYLGGRVTQTATGTTTSPTALTATLL